MSDDVMYESKAREFILYANNTFDFKVAAILGIDNYLAVFWPYVMCFGAKLFHTEYAGRIINCILSVFCIYQVFQLTEIVTNSKQTALTAAKLFAYLPYPWIICCFPLKDIFLTFTVLYIFILFVKYYYSIEISAIQLIVGISLLVAVYFTRGGVVEFLGLVGGVYLIKRNLDEMNTNRVVFIGIVSILVFFYLGNNIIDAFKTKLDDYNSDEYISSGALRFIQINKLTDLWKLPATSFFAMIQPMTLNLFSVDLRDWSWFLRFMNMSLYPIAFGNIVYMFTKKYDVLFWVTSFIMYASVFSLSLGIYRHYLFLFPFVVINYACNASMEKPQTKRIEMYGSIALFFIVILLSLK